jgi:hypothetical protein
MDEGDVATRSARALVEDVEPGRMKGLVGATDIAEELHSRGLVKDEAGATPHERLYGRADPSKPGAPGAGSLGPMAADQSAVAADVDSGRIGAPDKSDKEGQAAVQGARSHRHAAISNIFLELRAVVLSPKVKLLTTDPRGKALKKLGDAFDRFLRVAIKADGSVGPETNAVKRAARSLKSKIVAFLKTMEM